MNEMPCRLQLCDIMTYSFSLYFKMNKIHVTQTYIQEMKTAEKKRTNRTNEKVREKRTNNVHLRI